MGTKTSIGLLFLLAVSLGVVRSDCRVGATPKKEHINFWNGFTGPDGRTMLQIIRDFDKENPGIEITMQRMEWATYYNKLMVAAVDGRGPELFVIHASTLPRMHRAGFLANVKDLYDGPSGIPSNDFDEYVLKQVRFGDEYVGIPLDIHPQGLYGNSAQLKAVGSVDAQGNPKLPTTKAEFMDLCKKLQKDNDGDGHPDNWGYALSMWRNNFMSLIPQFDGRYLDENGRADLENPGNVAALTFMQDLILQKLVPPPENGLGWVGYRQQKVAMVWEGVYMLGDLQRLNDMPYVGAPIPTIGKHPGTLADSHVLCIRKDISPEKRAAVEKFVQFLSRNSVRWAGAGQVPARKSVRASAEFQKLPVQLAFSKQIPYMMYPPRTTVLFEMQLEIDLAVEKVLRGRATPQEALHTANVNFQRFLDRDVRERQPAGGAK